jgi:GNAT superfamily N-acetyltransferase
MVLSDSSDISINASLATTSDDATNALPSIVAGVVSIALSFSQTGPFHSLVEKFFASPSHRRLVLGGKLMAKLEDVTLENGRTKMIPDTTVVSPTKITYPRLRYGRLGVVERYGIHPQTGQLVEVWFWKDLNVDPRIKVEA